jgi:hypothetical protein
LALISAERAIDGQPGSIYALLANLENHRWLTGRGLHLTLLDDGASDDGRIQIRGPLGLRRTATTTVTTAREPHQLGGHARVGRVTTAHVMWTVVGAPEGSSVCLEVTVVKSGLLDRLLLALGGTWWLKRCLAEALERLAAEHALVGSRNGSARQAGARAQSM